MLFSFLHVYPIIGSEALSIVLEVMKDETLKVLEEEADTVTSELEDSVDSYNEKQELQFNSTGN